MPCDYSKYPKDWKQIGAKIRERAGHKCEWCKAPHGQTLTRAKGGYWLEVKQDSSGVPSLCGLRWRDNKGNECNLPADYYDDHIPPMLKKALTWRSKCILTVAHLGTAHADGRLGDKHDKMDCRPENLAALCQSCHLTFDVDEHVANARKTRRARSLAVQPEMEFAP